MYLEAGTVVGDGTMYPYDGLPSLNMVPLDDAAEADIIALGDKPRAERPADVGALGSNLAPGPGQQVLRGPPTPREALAARTEAAKDRPDSPDTAATRIAMARTAAGVHGGLHNGPAEPSFMPDVRDLPGGTANLTRQDEIDLASAAEHGRLDKVMEVVLAKTAGIPQPDPRRNPGGAVPNPTPGPQSATPRPTPARPSPGTAKSPSAIPEEERKRIEAADRQASMAAEADKKAAADKAEADRKAAE
jgi:hypothetical protein